LAPKIGCPKFQVIFAQPLSAPFQKYVKGWLLEVAKKYVNLLAMLDLDEPARKFIAKAISKTLITMAILIWFFISDLVIPEFNVMVRRQFSLVKPQTERRFKGVIRPKRLASNPWTKNKTPAQIVTCICA